MYIFEEMKPDRQFSKLIQLLLRLRPLHRLILSLLLACCVFFIAFEGFSTLLVAMIAWIIFAFTYTLSGWIILFLTPVERIKKVAKADDGSKIYVFVTILVASFASLLMVLLLLITDKGSTNPGVFIGVVTSGMLISWTMVHTVFTFHYAHMFYDIDISEHNEKLQGLDFPGETSPDYIDFAYLSFVIGCTFQVSDVQVKSKQIRRTVLLHGLISFLLNTFVVALTINFIAGLRH